MAARWMSSRPVAVGTAAVLAIGAAAAVGTAAGPALATPSGAATSVTVFLKAPHPQALAKLASAHGLTHAQRLQRLRTLVPGTADRARVSSTLRTEGLRVVRSTAWSFTASGPESTVSALFGTRPALSRSGANIAAAAGALPLTPLRLAPLVSAVFPTTGGPAPFHHYATSTLAGPDFRRADTPATVTPSAGKHDAKLTVATLQLADFYHSSGTGVAADKSAADLVSYAAEHHLANPVANKKYKPVTVDGGPSSTDDTMGGDVEVNLDQQSILSTAPSAQQHAYFAPNTNAGFVDVFASVYDDVVGNRMATSPDPGISALSVSWGQCESGWGKTAIHATEPVIESLVAAGVTVFASSGDDGIYDCRSTSGTGLDNRQADVDFPSSSPYVVSVGGSNLSAATSTANTGKNWTETAWTCTSAVSCQNTTTGTGGTGGGASGSAYSSTTSDSFAGFAAPKYQTAHIKDKPFAGAPKRLVPDITADGDPATGFVLYTSNPEYVALGGGNDLQVGGTSLASPISAAQLTNTLGDAGVTRGVGDIHAALYTAYSKTAALAKTNKTKVFRDVTVGSNGAAANKGTDPSVSAQAGYDTTSGVGGVLWKALLPYLHVG